MKYSHSLQKLLWSIIAITLSLCFLSACGNPSALEIGFDRGGRLPSLMSAVKSDHTDFEINDVTLDFYFGGLADEYPPDHEHISVGVALYFCNEEAYSALELDTPYSDYQTLDGLYFIKIISTEEFNSDKYEVDVSRFGKATFQHSRRHIASYPTEHWKRSAASNICRTTRSSAAEDTFAHGNTALFKIWKSNIYELVLWKK